jgi:hypothetical protein
MVLALMLCFGAWLAGCGGSSSSSTPSTSTDTPSTSTVTTSGYTVPTKVSAVPTSEGASVQGLASSGISLKSKLKALSHPAASAATDPGTDYSEAETSKYVEEHALEQFDIIEEVLGAINQTHYADAENINAGPYLAMVAWTDEQDGREIKQLQPWIIDSAQIVENGQNVLRVRAWIEEEDEGETCLIKAEFKVYAPATKRADGSYADYGVWTMNVKFDDTGEDFFAASASVTDDGKSVIKVHEAFPEGLPGAPIELLAEMKAIMYISDTEGYGKVYYPDFESLFGPEVDPGSITEIPHVESKYAYSADYLAVQEQGSGVTYKNRNAVTEMVHRYGVYNADSGQDVMEIKSFGFPIRYTVNGNTKHAYYGAWQGRHQLWGPNGNATIPEGTEVSREDIPPDQTPEVYTVGETFQGVLVKRTLVDADVSDVMNIPVEIWVNEDYNLIYIDHDNDLDSEWCYCTQMDWEQWTCAGDLNDFDENIGFEALIMSANDDRKWVYIGRWDETEQVQKQYVYEAASAENDGAGFYEATDVNGKLTVNIPRVKLVPEDGMDMWLTIGGSLYVEYTGTGETGWVEKEVVGFNTMTWTPEFGENDRPYTLPLNKEVYVNMQGANYIVKRTGADTYETKLELQTAVNPSNATTIVASNTVFKDPWNPDGNSTYEFITDPDDPNPNYLMLVYKTIGDNDINSNVNPGEVVAQDLWGLQAYVGEVAEDMFNWEYQGETEDWGSVTYLKNGDGSYKLVDDPMRFDTIVATNGAGQEKTLALQYDGWMMGLPMMYEELMKNDWVMTEEIANKIINLPAGTQVVESSTLTTYLLKPLEVSQFLNAVTDTTGLTLPDISQADAVDLNTVPDFVEHGIGDKPDVTTVKYSEGKLVQ